jgi:colicin import membrane protein
MLQSGALTRAETTADTTSGTGPDVPPTEVLPPPRRPNLNGDLDSVLEFLPSFRGSLHGYDRSQVDSYVSWAEQELHAARRSADEMAARFAACSVELDRVRGELARAEAGRQAQEVSDRLRRILELAGEEAAALTAAAAAEADGVVADAREYAAAMLRHAQEVEDAARAEQEEAAATRDEASAVLAAARAEAEELRAAAVREQAGIAAEAEATRQRLDRESATRRAAAEERARRQREQEAVAAAEVVAAARREIEELHAQRDRAGESLRQLTVRVGDVLQTLGAGSPNRGPDAVAPQPRDRRPAGAPLPSS